VISTEFSIIVDLLLQRYAFGGSGEPRQLGLAQGVGGSVGQTCMGELGCSKEGLVFNMIF
jgi:hypothetical protein